MGYFKLGSQDSAIKAFITCAVYVGLAYIHKEVPNNRIVEVTLSYEKEPLTAPMPVTVKLPLTCGHHRGNGAK